MTITYRGGRCQLEIKYCLYLCGNQSWFCQLCQAQYRSMSSQRGPQSTSGVEVLSKILFHAECQVKVGQANTQIATYPPDTAGLAAAQEEPVSQSDSQLLSEHSLRSIPPVCGSKVESQPRETRQPRQTPPVSTVRSQNHSAISRSQEPRRR